MRKGSLLRLLIIVSYRKLCIRAGTKVAKLHSKLRQQKQTNIRRFARVFINVALTLNGYRSLQNWIIAL